ncbi:hypothetical protein PFFCH_04361 [Plasmodium falciparum FCH/4]|uniref:EF-hand domain-containing protein n=1 Tax=Plasmodium falciparum FCH/4 TaxID=1036724 RepID=A0A024VHK2_PLAFA|nr:hypothetical protein PFFCH_04361 [Plasmodium falciparum FCH/4]
MFKGNKIIVGTINIFNSAWYTIKEKLSVYPFEYNYNIDRKNLLYKHFFYNKLDIICLQEFFFYIFTIYNIILINSCLSFTLYIFILFKIRKIISDVDKDGSGTIDFNDFLDIMTIKMQTYLGICNCHIHWNPLYPDIKLYHAYLIIRDFYEFIQNTVQDIPFIPLLLIGDFNSTPHIDHKKEDEIIQASGVYE